MRSVGLLLLCAGLSCARSLLGVIDVHAHVDPETIPRSVDAITLARLAQQESMRRWYSESLFPYHGDCLLVHRVLTRPALIFGGIALQSGSRRHESVCRRANGSVARTIRAYRLDAIDGLRVRRPAPPQLQTFVRAPIVKDGELLPETKQVLAIALRVKI